MCRILPGRDFSESDKKLFSESEFNVLKEVAAKFSNSSTEEIEKASHDESPWRETSTLEQIPYYLAAHDEDSSVGEEEIKLATQLAN